MGFNPTDQLLSPQKILDYEILPTVLGKGSWSVVRLGKHIVTGEFVAVKIFDKQTIKNPEAPKREAAILQQLNHPNIIQVYGVVEEPNFFCIIEELVASGTLYSLMQRMKRLTERQAGFFFSQILSAVEYCHQAHSLSHRDLKLDNILLTQDMSVKLIDFNLSEYMTPGNLLKKYMGSLPYAPPEVLRRIPYDGEKADVWSLGCILYVLVCGKFPFFAKSTRTLASMIIYKPVIFPQHLSPQFALIMSKMLDKDPSNRPTIYDLIQFPWKVPSPVFYPRPIPPTSPRSTPGISVPLYTTITPSICSPVPNQSEECSGTNISDCSQVPGYVRSLENRNVPVNSQDPVNDHLETENPSKIKASVSQSTIRKSAPCSCPPATAASRPTLSQLPSYVSNVLLMKSSLIKQDGNCKICDRPRQPLPASCSMVITKKMQRQNQLAKSCET